MAQNDFTVVKLRRIYLDMVKELARKYHRSPSEQIGYMVEREIEAENRNNQAAENATR